MRGFVVRVLGGDPPPAPRARIGPLPPGRMLVTSPRGAWVVARRRVAPLLGAYTGARGRRAGLYVVAWSGADVTRSPPTGRVAWTLRTPAPRRVRAWSPDGYRVAYAWLLLPAAAAGPQAVAISPVAQRFGGVPTVRGWCCA